MLAFSQVLPKVEYANVDQLGEQISSHAGPHRERSLAEDVVKFLVGDRRPCGGVGGAGHGDDEEHHDGCGEAGKHDEVGLALAEYFTDHVGDQKGQRVGQKPHTLFEGDAVMQTARRATASVAGRCDQEITLRN